MNIHYCTDCGKPMKKVKRKPQFSATTGKLLGYQVIYRCKRFPMWNCWGMSIFEQAI